VDAIIVVDMQVGLLNGPPEHDLQAVVQRINSLTAMVREQSGQVIWVRHCGKTGDCFERDTEGWSFLPELSCHQDDVVIEKTLNDPFVRTSLPETLKRIAPDRVLSPAGQLTLRIQGQKRKTNARAEFFSVSPGTDLLHYLGSAPMPYPPSTDYVSDDLRSAGPTPWLRPEPCNSPAL
jgi:Isochorismatase family